MIWVVLGMTVLLGAAMRFYRLGTFPPGLYHDEALNGLDAQRVLEGIRPVFFEANNGREPLFLYAMALAMSVLGRTPFAVRVMAAVLGVLGIPATFLMARALFGERVGLWSAFLMAVSPWPVNLSRIGLRAISMPTVVALALWLWWSGRDRKDMQRAWRLLVGGALLGLSLYTYTAARLVFVAVVLFVLFQMWVGRDRPRRRELPYLALSMFLATMPLTMYGLTHWAAFFERPAQVSVFSSEISHGDSLGVLSRNVLRAAGLFTFLGDRIPRHNVPLRPLFDPLISVPFFLGVLLSLVKVRKGGPYALALIWTGIMLIPTILAEDCPHFLRAVGVLPMAMVFPSLGLEWVTGRLGRRGLAWLGYLVTGAVLGASAVRGGYDYFVRCGGDPDLAYAFEADQLQEAVEINRFLGTGWQGEGVHEPAGELYPDRRVYLGPRLWEDRFSVNLLVASPEQVSILGRDPATEADQVLVLAWPHEDMTHVRGVLPRPARVEVQPGPLERADLDLEPRLLYVAFRAASPTDVAPPLARFEEGIELVGWEAGPKGDGQTRLRLHWRAGLSLQTDYTVFAHLMRDGQVIAQTDGAPGGGYYPTSWWRAGDEVVGEHVLDARFDPGREQIVIGWYELNTMQHLRVLGEEGQPGSERLELR